MKRSSHYFNNFCYNIKTNEVCFAYTRWISLLTITQKVFHEGNIENWEFSDINEKTPS